MKKLAITFLVALLVVGYPVASWMVGKQAESVLNEQYNQLEGVPYLKVVKREYERGVLVSHDRVTIQLFGGPLRAPDPAQKMPGAEPIQVTVRSTITHGPLPGLSALAVAVIDSELELDERLRAEVSKVLGDKAPLTVRTVYRFDGSGSAARDGQITLNGKPFNPMAMVK